MPARYILIPLVSLFLGCHPAAKEPLEEMLEHTYPLQPDAKITIRNRDGNIAIFGGNTNELKLEVIKRAYLKERLVAIKVNVSAQPDAISIDTVFPPTPRWGFSDRSGTVDYALVVPQTAIIEQVELSTGEINIEGMRGPKINCLLKTVRLSIRNCFTEFRGGVERGMLAIIFDWWESNKILIDTGTDYGNVQILLPGNTRAHLLADAENGEIRNDFADSKSTVVLETEVDQTIGANPTAEIGVRALHGNIEILEQNP